MFSRTINEVPVEVFRGINEMFDIVTKRSSGLSERQDFLGREKDRNADFYGVKNYEEGMQFLRKGFKKAVENMKTQRVDTISSAMVIQRIASVAGGSVDVASFLCGVPECFRRRERRHAASAAIRIVYDVTASAAVDAADLIRVGSAVFRVVNEIQNGGQRVELFVTISVEKNGNKDICVVKIKDAGEPIDLTRLSFCLCSAAFFRWLGFHWISTLRKGAYGYSLGHPMDKKLLRTICQTVLGKETPFAYITAQNLLWDCGKKDGRELADRVLDKINIETAKQTI